ncbi:MAG: hypothetical protein AAF446_00295 [Pseudomonadota bacterium]
MEFVRFLRLGFPEVEFPSAESSGSYAELQLGSVFVPACTLLQPNAGLHAYVPSMPEHQGKPADVPDQTALMFWTTPEAHEEGFKVVAVRTYTNLHSLVYAHTSKSQFPVAFNREAKAEQPYYLIDQPADWMFGDIRHLVGARKSDQSVEDFLKGVGEWATAYQSNPPHGVDGALLCAGNDYLVLWEHWDSEETPSSEAFDALAAMVTPFLKKQATSTTPPAGLWDPWAGFDLLKQDCINIQLDRPPVNGGGA